MEIRARLIVILTFVLITIYYEAVAQGTTDVMIATYEVCSLISFSVLIALILDTIDKW